ncbi:hypothetical protein [Comamonas sp. NLF-1-9]|uniref:hypothetical protein n=1 Tax=Comamonas sp. NLF-1-9 TaxID=2853163 RepID=UPI001C47B21C|nr:hypothetical protein [Comamonas sp. NLF-1-9]QXL83885.1 hypothetical protein KUD94_11630 [Comamonas sp. NLF-1-9]
MREQTRTRLAGLAIAGLLGSASTMAGASDPALFKLITARDEVIVAVPPEDALAPRAEAGAIGQALAERGALTLWQYAVRKNADGALELAPLHKVSVLKADSLRVEPYVAKLRVLPLPPAK